MPIPTPQPGFVHLILKDPFYLEIPIQTVSRLCLKPLKYLRFIGWCVLGVLGELVDQVGNGTDLHGTLADQGIYEYRIPHTDVLARVVQLDYIKSRSDSLSYRSTLTSRGAKFRKDVLARDGCCVWTGLEDGSAMHILPRRLGDEVCFLFRFLLMVLWAKCHSCFSTLSEIDATKRTSARCLK